MSSTEQKDTDVLQDRLKLIKQRHRKLILNSDDAFMDSFAEDEDTFDAFDEHQELNHYEMYVASDM